MSRPANPVRGEASVAGFMLRPSFAALVAAEEELGPLFALVERAAAGKLKLSEMVALFWHCRFDVPADVSRDAFSDAVAGGGLATATPALKTLLGQILGGR
jgi:Phage tail tube protein, GTA-gp10